MSTEVTFTRVVMPELALIEVAASRVGCELVRDKKTYRSWNRGTHCDHAIRVVGNDGAYEAGLVWNDKSNGYSPRYDADMTGGRELERAIGKGGALLLEAYMQAGVDEYAANEGYNIESSFREEQTGDILVELVRQS